MAAQPLDILRNYPLASQARAIVSLGGAGGFSGSRIWRVETGQESLFLRRWPTEHPSIPRLRFIHSVVDWAALHGFERLPRPLRTRYGESFVTDTGQGIDTLWELTPWMPGKADFRERPTTLRLKAALATLAEFHRAVATFPEPGARRGGSPGVADRLRRLTAQESGGLAALARSVARSSEQAADMGTELPLAQAKLSLALFAAAVDHVRPLLNAALHLEVAWQPCLRDIWHDHVFFEGDQVTAIVDLGSMRMENVAADVARLLGSLAGDDLDAWRSGLAAYEAIRPLADAERHLIAAFDASTVLLANLNWIEWLFVDGRRFDDMAAVANRLDAGLARMEKLAAARPR